MTKKKRLEGLSKLAPKFEFDLDLFSSDSLMLKKKFPFKKPWVLTIVV
jgi:hypothetical protein